MPEHNSERGSAGNSARHPAASYEHILERDTRPIPDHLREKRVPELGLDPVEASRYTSPEFARLEEQYLWPFVWQMACREEEIPQPGDTLVYEIVDRSFLIVRQHDGSIRAFYNSCLHRGRKLLTRGACKSEFRCPFHGMAWRNDGSFKDNPIGWDFPHWAKDGPSLPQARVDCWGGFVFINLDMNAEPLATTLAPVMEDFERYGLADFYISMHIEKIVACNWKAVAEAFMESHHTATTHPQLTSYLADVNSQYDAPSDHVSRQLSAGMVQSPILPKRLSETEIVQAMLATGARRGPLESHDKLAVPEGSSARAYMASLTRQMLSEEDGYDYEDASDAELVDSILYNLFPHMSFWATHGPKLVYRWRPNGRDPDSSIMDIYQLKRAPKDQPRPAPAPPFRIEIEQAMTVFGPLGGMSMGLAKIFEQDMDNLPEVQNGMKASCTGLIHFGNYSEMRLRLMHQMIDRYIAAGLTHSEVSAT